MSKKLDEGVSLAAFKKANKLSSITICKSRKGNHYAVDSEGEYLFGIAANVDITKPSADLRISEFEFEDGTTGFYAYIPGGEVVATW
jgi:hypothetical protein